MFIFEDPPIHDLHRGLMSRVFTPRRVAALEGRIREFCAQALDRFVGSGGFDYVRDLGADMPMRVISEMLGIPEADQERCAITSMRACVSIRIAQPSTSIRPPVLRPCALPRVRQLRRRHPSDDLMTDLITDERSSTSTGGRHLDEEEICNYATLLAAAGNETTTRLYRLDGLPPRSASRRARASRERSQPRPGTPSRDPAVRGAVAVQARYVTREVELTAPGA
jgi:cytochrome P450